MCDVLVIAAPPSEVCSAVVQSEAPMAMDITSASPL